MTKAFISVNDFSMRFGNTVVIDDLSFDVLRGETFGFLGSNGSGKTTTIRSLLGLYVPTSGTLEIGGKPFSPGNGIALGYLPEERGLYRKETVIETMVYFGRLKGLPSAEARTWSVAYLERVGLADKAMVALSKLSGGQQQKVQLGVTIMNNPELLILDEPTKGFDPVNRRLMMDIVEERKAAGATVILVTHQMEEVERLCDRVMLLKDGKRRLYGTVDEVQAEYGEKHVEIAYSGHFDPKAGPWEVVATTRSTAQLRPNSGVGPRDILVALTSQNDLIITSFQIRAASLDDIFIRIYGEEAHV